MERVQPDRGKDSAPRHTHTHNCKNKLSSDAEANVRQQSVLISESYSRGQFATTKQKLAKRN